MTTTHSAPIQASAPPADHGLIAMVPHINIQAYCEDQRTAEVIQVAAADRRMQRARTEVHLGGIMGAFRAFQTQATPNLLIVEGRGARETVLTELASLAEVCQPDTKVIVLGQVNDVLLYRELLRRGVSEYLVAPHQQMQIIEAVAAQYQSGKGGPLGRVLAFIGAKGGTGSSSIAQNVGWALARSHGVETVIADLDIAFGTAGLNFNQDISTGIGEVLGQPDRVDAVLIERMLTKVGERFSILGGPGGVDRDFEIDPLAIEAILASLRVSVPGIVLDLPSVWAPWMKFTLLQADQVVITATPELASLRNARSLVDLLKVSRPNDPPPKLILNQLGTPKRPEISAAEFGKAVGVPVSVTVPYDALNFGLSHNNGQMLLEIAPKSKAAAALSTLVQQLWGQEKQPGKTSGSASLLSRIAQLRKKK
jgi:pilus assembly protein CpaE